MYKVYVVSYSLEPRILFDTVHEGFPALSLVIFLRERHVIVKSKVWVLEGNVVRVESIFKNFVFILVYCELGDILVRIFEFWEMFEHFDYLVRVDWPLGLSPVLHFSLTNI